MKSNRNGAILPLLVILLPVLLLLSGFAINVAYMQLSATQVQISTDASTRAAGHVYLSTLDETAAWTAANDIGALNLVAGAPLQFKMSDLQYGTSTRANVNSRYVFTNTNGVGANAVHVTGRRNDGSLSGTISTFMPNLMGTPSFGISSSSISTQMEIDLVLVFDRSGSMAYAADEPAVYPPIPVAAVPGWDFGSPVPNPSRWQNAVSATDTFLNTLETSSLNERVALVTYSDYGNSDVGLTSSYGNIMNGLDFYSTNFDGGGTNIADGLAAGVAALSQSGSRDFAAKVIVLMTDGHRTVGSNPVDFANTASEDGIMIICVTFSDEADQSLMEDVASAGNGFHKHAELEADLIQVFDGIARELPTLLTQ